MAVRPIGELILRQLRVVMTMRGYRRDIFAVTAATDDEIDLMIRRVQAIAEARTIAQAGFPFCMEVFIRALSISGDVEEAVEAVRVNAGV